MDRTYFGGCKLRAHLAEESMFAKDKSTGFLLVSQGRWSEFKPDIQTNDWPFCTGVTNLLRVWQFSF